MMMVNVNRLSNNPALIFHVTFLVLLHLCAWVIAKDLWVNFPGILFFQFGIY